jgi:hypothetical protein
MRPLGSDVYIPLERKEQTNDPNPQSTSASLCTRQSSLALEFPKPTSLENEVIDNSADNAINMAAKRLNVNDKSLMMRWKRVEGFGPLTDHQ